MRRRSFASSSLGSNRGQQQMEMKILLVFVLLFWMAAEGAINYDPIRKGNSSPPGRAAPAEPYRRLCNPGDHCRGFFLSLRKESDVRIVPDAGNHTKDVIKAIASACAEYFTENNKNASEPPRVLILTESKTSTLIYQDAIRQGIAGKGLQAQYGLSSNALTTEDEASLHPIHGVIAINASLDLVNLKFSTPVGPLGATEMDNILERAAEIYQSFCAEGPCSEKIKLILSVNRTQPHLEGRSFQDYGGAVLKHLEKYIASDLKLQKVHDEDGVRASGFGGWFLVELSLHHPALQLYIEAPTHQDAVRLGRCVAAAVKPFPALNASALYKFVQSLY